MIRGQAVESINTHTKALLASGGWRSRRRSFNSLWGGRFFHNPQENSGRCRCVGLRDRTSRLHVRARACRVFRALYELKTTCRRAWNPITKIVSERDGRANLANCQAFQPYAMCSTGSTRSSELCRCVTSELSLGI